MPDAQDPADRLPETFVIADDILPREHIAMQAAAQRWIDSSISKTVNVPSDISFDAFKDLYFEAYESDLKGCTTFRFNPSAFQGVLVKHADLARTTYRFTLADGSVLEARGDEEIEYEGELHSAANLYDAIKEGYYGVY
jgi:ribonucleoside-diphosphate reductase alpha chain